MPHLDAVDPTDGRARSRATDADTRAHPLAGIDLNLLVALEALLRERSVTAAGRRLSVTQPTMSSTLGRLRALFDDELLTRRGRAMQLTPLAESLEVPVREILGRIEATVFSDRAFDPVRDLRTFTVAASDYASLVLLRPLLRQLAAEAPGVIVRVEALHIAEVGQRLSVDDVDLTIVPSRFSAGAVVPTAPLFADRFVAVAWRGSTRIGSSLTLDELRALPYLSFRHDDIPTMVDRRLEELDCPLIPQIELESFVVGANFLRGTDCLAFLQERLVRELGEAAELRVVQTPLDLPQVHETMAWHPRWTTDPAHRWLRDRVAALAATLPRA